MKKLVFIFAIFSGFTTAKAQADTSYKFCFGLQVATGAMQSNYTALYKYDYLLRSPSNINFNYPSPSIFIGNQKKFFVSICTGYAFNRQHKGTYNGYNITASGGQTYFGFDFSVPLKTQFKNKALSGIYLSAGMHYLKADIYSDAKGINSITHDTTFSYEASHAAIYAVNVEIMSELFNITKNKSTERMPLVVTLGYNIQIQKPQWTGIYYRNAGDKNPAVNLGGFYCRLGFNIWTSKQFWKSAFKKGSWKPLPPVN